MLPQDIVNCSFPSWYSQYEKLTIKSIVLKLPGVVLDYLSSNESVFVPDTFQRNANDTNTNSDSDTDSNSGDSWSSSVGESSSISIVEGETASSSTSSRIFQSNEFQDFCRDVDHGIKQLGGKAFPKLTWSSPRDACWISAENSLCCKNFSDVFLLLKSSDFIAHDLCNPFGTNSGLSGPRFVNHVLVLRKWVDIPPSSEFRCFVKGRNVVAISQRHSQYYEFISRDRLTIVHPISAFFKTHIQAFFPEHQYSFDVSLLNENDVTLIDFNPFSPATDSLLFTWDELDREELQSGADNEDVIDNIVFRHVPPGGSNMADSIRMHAYPLDFQHLSTGEDASKLIDLLKIHKNTPYDTD